MSVCSGPSTVWILNTIIIGIILPAFAIWGLYRLGRPKNKLAFAYTSVIVFVFLFIATLVVSFTLPMSVTCGYGYSCTPFENFPENGSCIINFHPTNDTKECNRFQSMIENMSEKDKEICPYGSLVRTF